MSRFALPAVVTAVVSVAAAVVVFAQPATMATAQAATAQAASQPTAGAGLVVRTTHPGSPGARKGDTVFVIYTGKLTDGTVFDSSASHGGRPFRFKLGEDPSSVIKGWEQGVLGMQIGEKRELVIPPALAYGPEGRPPSIPANATLMFEIELLGLVRLGEAK
jgi:FKBP-type peptidyl-prolyl cis-trans isomerase